MPNVGHRWTRVEDRGAVALGWDQFSATFPGISYSAYRARRKALIRALPTDLHARLKALNPTTCKVCRFLKTLPATEADEWRTDLARKPRGRDGISHYAVVTAIQSTGFEIEESSVRRHRRNHVLP